MAITSRSHTNPITLIDSYALGTLSFVCTYEHLSVFTRVAIRITSYQINARFLTGNVNRHISNKNNTIYVYDRLQIQKNRSLHNQATSIFILNKIRVFACSHHSDNTLFLLRTCIFILTKIRVFASSSGSDNTFFSSIDLYFYINQNSCVCVFQ